MFTALRFWRQALLPLMEGMMMIMILQGVGVASVLPRRYPTRVRRVVMLVSWRFTAGIDHEASGILCSGEISRGPLLGSVLLAVGRGFQRGPGPVLSEAHKRVMRRLGFEEREIIQPNAQDNYTAIFGWDVGEGEQMRASLSRSFYFLGQMNPSTTLIWNVRGLNQRDHRNSVREVILSSNADIVCLQETKVANMSQHLFLSVFGSVYDNFIALPANGTRGEVLIAWKGCSCLAVASRWFTGVYGPQEDDEKVMFLQELRNIRALCNGAWLLGGDFNLIYQAAGKNNANLDRAIMGRFRHFLDDMDLKEIPLLGQKYTWSNERRSPTLVRLDQAFCCGDWDNIFPDDVLQSTAAGVSDHCPLILGLKVSTSSKWRFHFESFWTKIPGFLDVVKLNWEVPVQSNCVIERLFIELHRLSKGLQKWGQRKIGNIKAQLELAREILHRLEIERDSRALSEREELLRKKLKLHCLGLASLERTIARLHSRILYLQEGDANTVLFHQQARYRKKKNFIPKLQVGNQVVVSQEEKHKAVDDFYENILWQC
ncbi:unnamed protein product [Miscanthus lutarioriparius]|uniref:Endonuclease/exonuclease/phosphatase domain-containing protein n=1 Tax=Miscanthus lutarioriparius TaxID=422564 RepID=A0A811Q0F0_9POAL|nr:unnamed protein product [Miscanthus lutarioriparius]